MDTVDLRRLQVLRLVDQQGTVTAAAASLHLTPSAVSHQLSQLSRQLGLQLLERRGRRVRLTAAGRALVAHADALQERWEEARADLDTYADGAARTLLMCGFPTAVAGLLAPAAESLRRGPARLQVSVAEVETSQAYALLMAGDADIAVTVPTEQTPPPRDATVDQQVLVEEPLDLLVPADSPWATRSTVVLSELAEADWVAPAPGSCDFHQLTVAACTGAGFNPHVAHRAKDAVAVGALVGHGLGVALVPRLCARHPAEGVVRLRLEGHPRPSRQILLCTRAGSSNNTAVRTGVDTLRAVAATLA